MDKDRTHQELTALVVRDFELEGSKDQMTEEELFDLLANQVAYMIEYKLDVLLSLMYRLDIPEHKVHHALSPYAADPANIGIAKLVFERQKKRAYTKSFYKQPDLGDIGDLAF